MNRNRRELDEAAQVACAAKRERGYVPSGSSLRFSGYAQHLNSRVWWAAFCVWLVLVAGCGWWGGDEQRAEVDQPSVTEKAVREKPDFELSLLTTLPNNVDRVESHVKPGHWYSAELLAEANRGDFEGRLIVDPVELEGVPFLLRAERPALLAKEQQRRLPFSAYTPVGKDERQIATSLTNRRGDELARTSQPLNFLPPQQYYFVVLARQPEAYGYLRTLPTVRAPSGMAAAVGQDHHYRVLLPRIEQQVPLPSSWLTWTSIAYVLWDDLDPEKLVPDQQQALLDWLHWGGQLIVSGPRSLERLRGSFLAELMPATALAPFELDAEEWQNLSVPGWTIEEMDSGDRLPTVAVQLQVANEASTLSSVGEWPLLVERPVGRGRVCVSAVGLADPGWRRWSQFDAWWNACVLRRASRRFEIEPTTSEWKVSWADGTSTFDARQTTRLRIFSRDMLSEWSDEGWHTTGWRGPHSDVPRPEDLDLWLYDRRVQTGPGMGAWDAYGVVSNAARRALREAAGLSIPSAQFVLRVVALYLAVLVPTNWLLFKALGRVEWSWAAVPVVSLVFTILVARWAQLDIGFARAETELGVIEMQAGYSRAHVTRYTALYTSLSTRYGLQLDDVGGLILPFPDGSTQLPDRARDVVTYRRDQSSRLDGFRVVSNSIGLAQCEHMFDTQGSMSLKPSAEGGWSLTNSTLLYVEQAGVIGPEGVAWIGRLPAGATVELQFESRPALDAWEENWNLVAGTSKHARQGVLNVQELLQVAVVDCPVDEFRLVGWFDGRLPG